MAEEKKLRQELIDAPLETRIAYAQLIVSAYTDRTWRSVLRELQLDPYIIFDDLNKN